MFEDDDFEDICFASQHILETENYTDSENDYPFCPCEEDNNKDMIFCDGPHCEYEWWHFKCAGLTSDTIPEGSWICPECKQSNGRKRQKKSALKTSHRSYDLKQSVNRKEVTKKGGKRAKESPATRLPPEENVFYLTKECAIYQRLDIFTETIKKCRVSPSAQLSKTIEGQLSKIACADDNQQRSLSEMFINECWTSVTAGDEKVPAARGFEYSCSSFHAAAYKPNAEIIELLSNMTGHDKTSVNHIYQLLFSQLMTEILNKRFGICVTDMTSSEPKSVTMNESEEQALRYACGYIPFSLMKHYRKYPKNEFAIASVSALQNWRADSDQEIVATDSSFMSYTKAWLELINRGKLFSVSDETYSFFRATEFVVKEYLNMKNLRNLSKIKSVKHELIQALKKNKSVLQTWYVLTSKVNEQVAEKLHERVLKKFVDMRCSSFCSVYLTCKKLKNPLSVSARSEKSLRVQLLNK